MPQSERASTLKVLHMGNYAINKMNLRARETSTDQASAKTSRSHITDETSVQSLQELSKR